MEEGHYAVAYGLPGAGNRAQLNFKLRGPPSLKAATEMICYTESFREGGTFCPETEPVSHTTNLAGARAPGSREAPR